MQSLVEVKHVLQLFEWNGVTGNSKGFFVCLYHHSLRCQFMQTLADTMAGQEKRFSNTTLYAFFGKGP